jgi:hypothetical protein
VPFVTVLKEACDLTDDLFAAGSLHGKLA